MTKEIKNGKYESNGIVEWYFNGVLHKIDGPAVYDKKGNKEFFINGERHCDSGPAIILNDRKEWWINGVKHREDGPAIEIASAIPYWNAKGLKKALEWFKYNYLKDAFYKEWYVYGIKYNEEDFNQWLEKKSLNEKLQTSFSQKPHQKKHKI